jgi:hypothetical protein
MYLFFYCNNVVLRLDKGWRWIGNDEKQASVYGQHKHFIAKLSPGPSPRSRETLNLTKTDTI